MSNPSVMYDLADTNVRILQLFTSTTLHLVHQLQREPVRFADEKDTMLVANHAMQINRMFIECCSRDVPFTPDNCGDDFIPLAVELTQIIMKYSVHEPVL